MRWYHTELVVTVTLDTHLRISADSLPEEILEDIASQLTFENSEKESARKEKRYGWKQMPDDIQLWFLDGDHFVMPRGFRAQFVAGMDELGINFKLADHRTGEWLGHELAPPLASYRPHQEAAAQALISAQDGIYEAPPGSGKTVTVLEGVRRAGMARNMIVVNRIELADQWRDRARQFLGSDFPVGIIGDGEWDEQCLTIATQQTLYAKRYDLDRDVWWDQWGVSCLDESHHQTARTFMEVMQRFPGRHRWGVSATPDKTGDFEYALGVLGDIVARTTRHELRETGVLVRPTIKVVHTPFQFPYHGTFTHIHPGKECDVCGKTKRHSHRNNYGDMMKALREDPIRNATIAKIIYNERDHRMLVVSPQKGHLETLASIAHGRYGGDLSHFYMMSGKETRKERQWTIDAITAEPGVVFSTIADEALDVPVLDREIMAWPTKNSGAVRQRVGRVEREALAQGKEDAVVYDIADTLQPVLAKQFLEGRRWGVYAPDLMKVENIDAEDVLNG